MSIPSRSTVQREWKKENAKRKLMGLKPLTVTDFYYRWYGLGNPARKRARKMTKTQRRAPASRAAKQRAIVKAVKGLLKKTNPSAKITGAKVVKLRDGVLKITPIKGNPFLGRGGVKRVISEYGHQRRGGTPRLAAVKRAISSTRRNPRRKR